ncbi:hypothetical protein NDU88_004889 [Pleurodeles waltl]|uniref:Uncharacterized protein n=1 Tax=Pleurodeles waltl TaxID=8319 RepID=A0AAV7NTS2_PLEWA|nr:hypothetical protein NDU88_004889 [Pleurodeles waltl]
MPRTLPQCQLISNIFQQQGRGQDVATREERTLKCRRLEAGRRATEEWRAAARAPTTKVRHKVKKRRTADQRPWRPRKRNASLLAALQEKRGNHRKKEEVFTTETTKTERHRVLQRGNNREEEIKKGTTGRE